MKKYITSILLIMSVFVVHGQKNQLLINIENAKEQNISFENISSAIVETSILPQNDYLSKHFVKPNEVRFFDYIPTRIQIGSAIRCQLPIGNKNEKLELIEVPDSFYDYVVTTSSGESFLANKNIKHYRGMIEGDSTSIVALSFNGSEIRGFISNRNGNYNIGLNKQLGKHVLYNTNNLKSTSKFECDTYDDYSDVYDPQMLLQEYRASNIVSSYKYVRLYIETEFDMYQWEMDLSGVEAVVTNIFNQVATIYQNEGISICLSEIHVWTTVDPYTETEPVPLLNQFQNYRTSINGDLGQLLSYKTNTVGGKTVKQGKAAGFNGLHSSSVRDKLSFAMLEPFNIPAFPNYSWNVNVMAHEFGHLFGSPHTHACVWNGNNTAIDGCANVEGTCSKPYLPSSGGTIMSYCQNVENIGINFSYGFGTQPGNVIRNSVATATGLNTITITGPEIVTTTGKTYTLNNSTASSWSCSSNLQIISSSVNSVTVKSKYDGLGWIKAVVNIGLVKPTITHEVWSGKPIIERIDGPNRTPNGQYATFRAIYNNMCSPTSFQWTLNPLNGNSVYGATTSVLDVAFYNAGSYQLVVRASNECGMGEYTTSGVNVYNANGRSYIAYPNPASQTLYVDFTSIGEQPVQTFSSTAVQQKHYDVRLFNLQGSLVRTARSAGERISLDVSGLPGGNYFLHIYDGKGEKPVVQQVIVSH